ncbi:UNVERIFIED_ORG: hypothetical protein QE446_000967 [Rhizobium sp. SORGH_AS260]|uniref:hypothetical protein n=1 Tax=Agrobacterium TaxID=357 RepID=UPI001FCDB081|nr:MULTISPECIES: hypothetical protein [Agrobacterium]MCJ2876700.1 hypothetical protein [Agrobacterium pusense]MDP9730833.1 hypothetical protein [Rhizobium sp. SORGH_AS_0285]MDP9753110.1 hypothetical protein [Rhizobium sp. SORGH_AS_0260]MDR6080078.1 hypothetical protein [Agrobacterium sp. SORGH_AS_0440]
MEEPKRSMSREELYALVWSTPMQKLAETYGLSDRGLAKTCQRYLVPVPSRGYWAKVDAGQTVKQTPLRAVENTALHTVHIGARPVSTRSPYLAQVLETALREIEDENKRVCQPSADESTPPVQPNPQNSPRISASKAEPSVRMESGKLRSEVQSFLAELRGREIDRDGYVSLKGAKVTPKDVPRVGAILNSLCAELEPYGFAFAATSTMLGFEKDGTTLRFAIDAPRKRQVEISRSGWQRFTYAHVGRLRLHFYGPSAGVKTEWCDTDAKTIEAHLAKIVENYRIAHVAARENDERNRQEAARRAHMASRRKMAEQRAKRESDRLSFLQSIANARREADDLRDTISSVPYCEDLPADYRRMLEWARKRLMQLEEQTRVEAIQTSLEAKLLFADPDPLHDPEGDPPSKLNYWDD